MTLEGVAAAVGFSKPYLSTIATGNVKNPPSDTLLKKLEKTLEFDDGLLRHIAHVERMPVDIRQDYEAVNAENRRFRQIIRNMIAGADGPSDLGLLLDQQDVDAGIEEKRLHPGQFVPVINRVSAGYPADFDDMGYPVGFSDDYVRCPDLHDPNAFAVRVVGDSMEPKFVEGDIVVFSSAADVCNGDDCFVRFTGPYESTFKRFFSEDAPQNVRLQPRNQKYAPIIVDTKRLDGIYRAVIRYQML